MVEFEVYHACDAVQADERKLYSNRDVRRCINLSATSISRLNTVSNHRHQLRFYIPHDVRPGSVQNRTTTTTVLLLLLFKYCTMGGGTLKE